MIDSTTFTQNMLSNPTMMASAVIAAMEASDAGQGLSINDPNNGFVMQLLASTSIYAKFSEKIDYYYGFFYPQRARTAEQLYPHLSQFDYVNLTASPATLPFYFSLQRQYIIESAQPYDDNYNKVEIPSTSYFTMGGVTYSMYYPISILVNKNTGALSAFYNTSVSDELYTLESNMLRSTNQYTQDGIDYFVIEFDMFQFKRTVIDNTVSSEQGFIATIPYEDQFYAVKVLQQTSAGWVPLSYNLSTLNYDYQTPTAILSLLSDSSQLKVEIPQIYFDNKQVSQNIRILLYSTKGAVNYSLSAADVTGITANFDTSSSVYAAPFAQPSIGDIKPTTIEVAGGSNAKSYAEMRDAIVNQRLYDRVAVTTPELVQAGKKAGFDITRIQDDLTDRIYSAANILTDSNGVVIPTFAGNILIANDALTGDPSSILKFTDGYYTILPTTTFTISNNGLTCTPMSDGQVAALNQMTTTQMVAELNKGIYVRQPFHITLRTVSKSPQAMVYNLLAPSKTSLKFIAENAHSSPQMSATQCTISHLGNGTGGYAILLYINRSVNILGVDASNFNVVVTCVAKSGKFVYLPATYNSTNQYGVDIWTIALSTSYHISNDDHITVGMYDENDTEVSVEIPLSQTFNIITGFTKTYEPTIPVDPILNALLPPSMVSANTVMSQQSIILSLGTNLSSEVYCGVDTSWGNDVYKTADETIYYQATAPQFLLNEQGIIENRYNTTTSKIEVVETYAAGSTPVSTEDLTYTNSTNVNVPTTGTITIIPMNDTTGVLVGMPIRGVSIPVGSTVTGVGVDAVIISTLITNVIPKGSDITFSNGAVKARTTAAQTNVSPHVTLASTAGLIVGQTVFGFDIPAGTTIVSIEDGQNFTLSANTLNPLGVGTLIFAVNLNAPGVVKIQKGDVVTDPTGLPIIIKDAQNQYSIPAILFDGRLFASQDPTDQATVSAITGRIQNYANQISTIDKDLIENSDVYYKPARTMGYANFSLGAGKIQSLSLELGFSFSVYVDDSTYNSQVLLSSMENTIILIVNTAIQSGQISVSDITQTIRASLGNNVTAVEGGDINGQAGLRLIALNDAGTTPSIENILVIQTDGSIKRVPNVQVTFLPRPDTSETTSLAV